MEENKNNELDVEVIDEELEEDEDIEEFDFNDDDIDEEDIDEDEESEDTDDIDEDADEDADEDTDGTPEEDGGEADGTSTEEGAEEEPKAEPSDDKAFEMELLKELGYTGTYEEAKAKYMADKGGTPSATVDYDAMARDALKEINEEFGLELKDFSGLENIELFAELCLNDKYGAVKAFAATNHKLVMEGAANKAKQDFASKLKPPSKDHLSKLPTSGGGDAKAQSDRISKKEYLELKALYPNLPTEVIIETIRKVRKNTKK